MSEYEENDEERTVEDMINELGYAWSSPEAEHFHSLLQDKNTTEAKEMLLEYYEEEEAQMILDYFQKKMDRKFNIIQTSIEEIEKEFPPVVCAGQETPELLCNIKGTLVKTYLYNNGYDKPNDFWSVFYEPKGFIRFDKSNVFQVWKVVEKIKE